MKVCNCYLRTNENFDVNKAKEWLSSAEKHFPFDKIIIGLKEKLHNLVDMINENDKDELKNWELFLTKAIVNNHKILPNKS